MKQYKYILLGVITILLSSCFAAKDYVRPEIQNTAYFRTDNISKDSTTIALISWREIFKDAKLQEYIDKGLENNIDIRIALQQIFAAEAYFKQGKSGYWPTLNINASASRQKYSENAGGNGETFNQFELSSSPTLELDMWGKIRSNKRAFEAQYLQTVAAHKLVKTQLIANIASIYYQLSALDAQIKITEQTIKNRKESLETIVFLKNAGNVTEVGVKQTEAQLYTAQALLVDLKNKSRLLENTLSILLGEDPHDIERNDFTAQQATDLIQIGVPSQLLRNRPDVIMAEQNLINAFELTNVARSNFYPSITITASGGLKSFDVDKLFDANSIFSSLIGGLTQPLLNGRKIRTQYEVSKAQQEQAKLNFKQTLLIASKEVSDAVYSYNAAKEKIEIKNKELEAYTIATDYSDQLLNNGFINYLEVLTARERALNSNLELINIKLTQLLEEVNLYEALGGGWQ
ncbi:efflux transporter outer membrane subunit [Aureibaculum marinum]|nr:efflux transporter outer membrane subunit [Aureibaculum marinum]